MGWEWEGMGIPHVNGMGMGISEKMGRGMGGNGNKWHGNGREWERKKPFPVISSSKIQNVLKARDVNHRHSLFFLFSSECTVTVVSLHALVKLVVKVPTL